MDIHGVKGLEGGFPKEEVLKVIHDTKRTELTVRHREGSEVVVKRFKMSDEEAINRFEAEVELMCRLSKESELVCRPLAHVTAPPNYAVLLPLYDFGSLDTILHNPRFESIDWRLRLLFANDMVKAVEHCHNNDIIIRDIKPGNMLVDANLRTRMSDLELAKTIEEIENPKSLLYAGPSSRRKTRFEGTPEYMPPELLTAPGSQLQRGLAPITKAADVYSIAISLMEIATSKVPYTDVEMTTEQLHTVVETRYSPSALHASIVNEGLRPSTTDKCKLFKELCEACWVHDKDARPPIQEVAKTMAEVRAIHSCAEVDENRLPHLKLAEESSVEAKVVQPLKTVQLRDWEEVLQGVAASPPEGRHGVLPQVINAGGEGTAGRRDFMEDEFFCHMWHKTAGRSSASIYGMLDGHGGVACAKFVKANLPEAIETAILSAPNTQPINESIIAGFKNVQEAWAESEERDLSGACCTVAVILEAHVWIAWCGDCTAVANRGGVAAVLTKDHHPDRPDEAERVKAAGGTIKQTADRKWRVNGRVAVSRSFGDLNQPGLTCVPEVIHYPIRRIDEMLILATDGVWDVMTPTKVVENLIATVRHPDYGAKRLACDAYNNGSTDNIASVVIYFTEAVLPPP